MEILWVSHLFKIMKRLFYIVIVALFYSCDVLTQVAPNKIFGSLDSIVAKDDSIIWVKHFSIYEATVFSSGSKREKRFHVTESGLLIFKEQEFDIDSLSHEIKQFMYVNFPGISYTKAYYVSDYLNPEIKIKVQIGELDVFFGEENNCISMKVHRHFYEELSMK
jgi:hypothetical protein